jgi:hypothetical protein
MLERPPLWSSGQSPWLQIQRSRVRFSELPDSCVAVGLERGPRCWPYVRSSEFGPCDSLKSGCLFAMFKNFPWITEMPYVLWALFIRLSSE